MSDISVLLPVGASTSPSDLSRSHQSLISQTKPPEEILLLTNQPLNKDVKTKIKDLVTDSKTRHERFPNATGLGGVLQAGLKHCSNPLIARMDADDIAEPDRFVKQQNLLTDEPIHIVGSHLAEFCSNPEQPERIRKVPTTHEEIAEWMPWRCPLNHPTTMFERDPVLKTGGYRDFPMMEDWDLWARCLANGLQFRNLDKVLVRAQIGDLAARRRGLSYAKAELRMAQELRALNIATARNTVQHICFRIPLRLLPISIHNAIYRLFAR
jgi:glycosyltransferase involved in cell wall biosynthesis